MVDRFFRHLLARTSVLKCKESFWRDLILLSWTIFYFGLCLKMLHFQPSQLLQWTFQCILNWRGCIPKHTRTFLFHFSPTSSFHNCDHCAEWIVDDCAEWLKHILWFRWTSSGCRTAQEYFVVAMYVIEFDYVDLDWSFFFLLTLFVVMHGWPVLSALVGEVKCAQMQRVFLTRSNLFHLTNRRVCDASIYWSHGRYWLNLREKIVICFKLNWESSMLISSTL